MATLEKIRSKSVFLLVVIFVALLAFILGDAITNGRNLFGDHTKVAKIGGEKIDYLDYQRKREELNQQLEQARQQNPQQVANFDVQLLPQMALNQLISEKLVDDAVKNLGIPASPTMLRQYLLENPNPTPEQIQIVRQLQAMNVNVTSMAQAHDAIFNPKRNNLTQAQVEPLQKAWLAIENDARQQLARQSYVQLLAGTVQANDLDRQALYNDAISLSQVSLAYRPYGQLDEKKYPVSDADLKKAYEAEKNRFKVEEPTKAISFIAVNVAPSDADRAEATKLSVSAAQALRDSSNTLSKDLRKEGLSIEKRSQRASDIPAGSLRNFVTSAPVDSVSVVSESLRGFTVAKVNKKTVDVDSVQLNIVQVAGAALPAKVLARLNGGLSIDSIASAFSPDSVVAQAAQWITLYNAKGKSEALQPAQLDSLKNAGGRYITLVSGAEGSVLAQLAKQGSPKEIYDYEVIEYELHPSAVTLNNARTKLEKFLAANKTAAAFAKNAEKEGYNVQEFELTQSSNAVPRMQGYNMYYPDSRQVVRWVMIDGKPGEVSGIYESKDAAAPTLYVAAVNSEYKDYIPMSNPEVKQYLTDKVRRSKAGDEMMKQYQPKAGSMQSVASAMGVEPTQLDQFRFGMRSGVQDPAVAGQIAGSKPGQKVVLVKGDDGIYAFVVKGTSKDKTPFDAATYDQQYQQMFNPNLEQMIRGSKKLENNIYKFEAGE
ncbi:MAG: SurA N-terminal domain-containing protein [Muribaculaceae bacterium]|nr:SurA N-terminal domain-containing protein [Muribaculaceae bacterium]